MASNRELLTTVRGVRRRLADVGPEHPRAEGDFERVSLPNGDCDVLRDLLASEHAHSVIEIGLAYGSSALAIAEALIEEGPSEAKHVIIDAYQDAFQNAGWEAMLSAGAGDLSTLLVNGPRLRCRG